jgi:uncharacterized protein (TIGR02246 family)
LRVSILQRLERDMATADEIAIQALVNDLADAWNRGDAIAYGAHYGPDATFTNANGAFYVGRDEFDRRHAAIFQGIFKGTTLAYAIKKLRFIRSDVSVLDIDATLSGCLTPPPGAAAGPDGALRSCLLMVLVKEDGAWWIAAYHNVWRKPAT